MTKAYLTMTLLGAVLATMATHGHSQTSGGPALAAAASDPKLDWGACPPIFPGDCKIAVLHGDPSQPNADVFLKVGAGYRLPLHRHTSAERMVLVAGQLRVKYEGAKAAMLKPGTYAYGPAGLPHDGACVSRTPCTLFIAFEGPVDAQPVAK